MKTNKILVGRRAICEYFGIGKAQFYAMVDSGLPVRRMGKPWVAHVDQLETFVAKYCAEGEAAEDYTKSRDDKKGID